MSEINNTLSHRKQIKNRKPKFSRQDSNKKKNSILLDPQYNNIKEVKIYKNFAIYLMKLGTKGNFKEIAKLANDGKEQMSWVCRIYYTNNIWTIQIASNPNLPKQEINLLEIFSILLKSLDKPLDAIC